jgi:DNA-binding NarL/FixJ family response regulator
MGFLRGCCSARQVDDFRETLERIAGCGAVIDPGLVKVLVAPRPARYQLSDLTGREHKVLRLMADGSSNAGVASLLWVTAATVEKPAYRIVAKLRIAETQDAPRRVLAVIAFLRAQSRGS